MAETKKAATAPAKAKAAAEAVDAITEEKDGKFTFTCGLNVVGQPVASSAAKACGFVSKGWPTEADAQKRQDEHEAEHATGEPMSELADFVADNEIEV